MKIKHTLTLLLFLFSSIMYSQDLEEDRNWDNQMYISNKIGCGHNQWRHSAEFQTRYRNDLKDLEQWHVEMASTYLINKKWEIVPDIRFTSKPTRYEIRPGLGAIYKNYFKKNQLVHQVKYQYDSKNGLNDTHGVRYGMFYNYIHSEELILTALAGGLFEFGPDWSGFLGLRTGISAAYVFNKAHTL